MSTAPRSSKWDWRECPRTGQPCAGFIPMKCPLPPSSSVDAEHHFTPSMFVEQQVAKGRSVGLCIDLTSPSASGRHLYDPSEWDDWDVQYSSLELAPAGGPELPLVETVPSEEGVGFFCDVVSRFQQAHSQLFIAVHCLTGFNTTGFLIVSFLARRGPIAKALEAFAKSRPPGIYSPAMLEALFVRFDSKLIPPPSEFTPPQPPPWHRISTRPLGKPSVPLFSIGPFPPAAASSTDAASRKRSRGDAASATAAAAPASGGPGTPSSGVWAQAVGATAVAPDEAARLHRSAQALVGLQGWIPEGGPAGGHAGSCTAGEGAARLTAESMGMMAASAKGAWLVSWIPQGERCVLLVTGSGGAHPDSILFDEAGGAWRLPRMHWPIAAPSAGAFAPPPAQHACLVILGDVVCDAAPGSPPVFRMLASDLLCVGGEATHGLPLSKRLGLLESRVLGPRKGEAAVAGERLRVRQRDCFKLGHTAYLFRRFAPKLTHGTRGICFLDAAAPFAAGPAVRGLEWRRDDDGRVPEPALLGWADQLAKA